MGAMRPYYQDVDAGVTLYHGDCREVLPTLAPESVGLLLTDPPYFQVKDEDWDRQWKQAADFLGWLGGVLDDAKPALLPSASVWVFAGPALATSVERVVGERFRVLNNVRWVKEQGWHQKAEIEAQRRYLTPWESIVFAERNEGVYEQAIDDLHKEMLAPVASYVEAERLRAGVDRREIAVALADAGVYRNMQTGAAMCSDWAHGDSLPPPAAYDILRRTLGNGFLLRPHGELRSEWDRLTEKFYVARQRIEEELRRPFRLDPRGPVSDVWNFGTVPPYPGKHPCEKPLPLLRHVLGTTTHPTDVVLDCFAGSGSTLLAARDMGRRSIGIEKDERWCEFTAKRLAQGDLFSLDGVA